MITRSVGLSDVRPNGRLRLDALARFLQDVADHDGHTAAIGGSGIWVLRRMSMRIAHTPRFHADVRLTTWCSGVGPRWAERRTDLTVGEGGVAEAVAIWVHVDAERGVPLPLPSGFDERVGRDRRQSPGPGHPPPSAAAGRCGRVLVAVAGGRPRRRRPREQRGLLGTGRGGAGAGAGSRRSHARRDRVPRRTRRWRAGRVPRRRHRRRILLLALRRR